jgi:hypothetical protein
VGVILLRLGRFSVGVFKGELLLTSKTDARYVKGRHRAGGSSQRRFERIREKQIYELFTKACSVVADRFSPYEEDLDYILLGGERHTLMDFLKECQFLRRTRSPILKRTLHMREPKLRELERTPQEMWKSQVAVFRWPQEFPLQDLTWPETPAFNDNPSIDIVPSNC